MSTSNILVKDHAAGEVHVSLSKLQSSNRLIVGSNANGNELISFLCIEVIVLLFGSLISLMMSLNEVLGEIDPVLSNFLESCSS